MMRAGDILSERGVKSPTSVSPAPKPVGQTVLQVQTVAPKAVPSVPAGFLTVKDRKTGLPKVVPARAPKAKDPKLNLFTQQLTNQMGNRDRWLAQKGLTWDQSTLTLSGDGLLANRDGVWLKDTTQVPLYNRWVAWNVNIHERTSELNAHKSSLGIKFRERLFPDWMYNPITESSLSPCEGGLRFLREGGADVESTPSENSEVVEGVSPLSQRERRVRTGDAEVAQTTSSESKELSDSQTR